MCVCHCVSLLHRIHTRLLKILTYLSRQRGISKAVIKVGNIIICIKSYTGIRLVYDRGTTEHSTKHSGKSRHTHPHTAISTVSPLLDIYPLVRPSIRAEACRAKVLALVGETYMQAVGWVYLKQR